MMAAPFGTTAANGALRQSMEEMEKEAKRRSYRILLTSLFHNREHKVSHQDMNRAMEDIDKHNTFPIFYKRMQFYFASCEQVMVSYLAPCTSEQRHQQYHNFVKYLFDAIGQSMLYLKKHYESKYYKVLHFEFRAMLTSFLDRVDAEDASLEGGSTPLSQRKMSMLQFFRTTSRIQIDKDCASRIRKMEVKDLLCTRYQTWADGIQLTETIADDYTQPALPAIREFCGTNSVLLKNLEVTLMKRRIGEMYSLCCEFPDCVPALDELRVLVDDNHAWAALANATRDIITARICAPHVATSSLIEIYIYAVQVLGRLESGCNDVIPSEHLLSALAPVQTYIQNRPDTVTEIVQSMLSADEESNVLAVEMHQGCCKAETEQDLWEQEMNWRPAKPGNEAQISRYAKKPKDLLSLMLSLYGSTDKFMKAYQRLLVQRLLSIFRQLPSLDIQPSHCEEFMQERKNLELLQSRFDQDSRRSMLDSCRVMFRDWEESLRFHREIVVENSGFNTLLVSDQCWSSIKDHLPTGTHDLHVNKHVSAKMDGFNQSYQENKGSRSVQYWKALGFVELEVDMEDGSATISVVCDQPCLSVLDAFSEKDNWSVVDLAEQLKMPKSLAQRHVNFWKQKYVLAEGNSSNGIRGTYQLALDEHSRKCRNKMALLEQADRDPDDSLGNDDTATFEVDSGDLEQKILDGQETGGGTTQANTDWIKVFDMYWTYMQNNIRSNKESSVDWLHKKLAIFARLEPDSDCEDEDALDVSLLGNKKKLKMYLQKKVREDQLVQVGDERYALPK